jgi:hypothetical protein
LGIGNTIAHHHGEQEPREEVEMTSHGVDLDHPENQRVVAFLDPNSRENLDRGIERLRRAYQGRTLPASAQAAIERARDGPAVAVARSEPLDAVPDPYTGLGTTPELVERLWLIARDLPEDCRWLVCRRAALVHPQTGIIFGFAFGTLGYALRLPDAARDAALAAGLTGRHRMDKDGDWSLIRAGPHWLYGVFHAEEPRWCRAAYEFATAA